MIYLDNASTTKIRDEVLQKMMPYLTEQYGNAGSLHELGTHAKNALDSARESVANLINCKPEQIVFTSGGSEANNLALQHCVSWDGYVVTSSVEHDSVNNFLEWYNCDEISFCYDCANTDTDGRVNVEEIERLVRNAQTDNEVEFKVGVSVMYVNNETGVKNDIEKIGKICLDSHAVFHTDCVQALGYEDIDVQKINCDFLTLSGHKIGAGKGVGVLYVKAPQDAFPMIFGGEAQEFGLRGGTENIPAIVGFGAACDILSATLPEERHRIDNARKSFVDTLQEAASTAGLLNKLHFNSAAGKIVNFRFDGIDSQTLVLLLSSYGVCVSAGSACRSHNDEPSRVLLSMGLTEEEARESVRVSFSSANTVEEVVEAAQIIVKCVSLLYNNGK